MGLCKCRVVTSLFCFQHKENVCESCIVSDHRKCMIKSYLQWLQDAEFSSLCPLCQGDLDDGQETIRLPCYDVFHVECLNRRIDMDHNTACPVCHAEMMPEPHNMSPVAKEARDTLERMAVDRKGKRTASSPIKTAVVTNGSLAINSSKIRAIPLSPTKRREGMKPQQSTLRQRGDDEVVDGFSVDVDEDKYAPRSAKAWFSKVVGNRLPARKDSSESNLKKSTALLIIVVLILFTVIHLLTKARPSGDNDPLLDPMMNPNLHIDT
eukprot:m.34690 g.34690  ORF g.34690 m.34690 type:complete len:266 (-) comp6548_c0_seq2:1231-2028(-)